MGKKYRPVYLPEQISRLLVILESISQLNTRFRSPPCVSLPKADLLLPP